jgi:hypothetical protein
MEDRRQRFRKGLNYIYIPYYDALCEILPEDWQPITGGRSIAWQNKLFAQGRTSPGDKVTDARGGESAHNYGCASDWTRWTPDGEPIWIRADDSKWLDDPEWNIYLKAVEDLGLRSGSEFDDPMHNEIRIAVPWRTIATIFYDRGMPAALASIQAAMISIKKDRPDEIH